MSKKLTKKWAIISVVIIEALVYLFLFVGLPAINNLAFCPTCTARELFTPPIILYCVPLLIGIVLLVVILKQKGEVKEDE